MNVRTKRGAIIGGTVLAGLAVLLLRHREPPELWYEPVPVQRGEVKDRLHLLGELAPRDPVLAKVGFTGRIQFIVPDGSWIEAGKPLVAVGEDDAMKEAAESRSQLLQARQELRLSRIKRRHAEESEALKVNKAERAQALEVLRFRILTSKPVGGDELLRLDAALKPKEAATVAVRAEQERIQADFQRLQDAFLAATDARAAHRDRLLRLETRIDELAAAAERSDEGMQEAERTEKAKATADLAQARSERDQLLAKDGELANGLRAARAARDGARPGRDAAAARLAAAEADEEDLRVRLEIEKANLQATLLHIDEASTKLALDDALRRRDQGRQSFAAGAMAKAAYDELEDDATRLTNQLDIVRAKIAIAERPLPPEVRAEADARLNRAKAEATDARSDRDRALALSDQEIAVLEARVKRLADQVEVKARAFPEIIESNLEFLDKELAGLDPDDADDASRRREAEAERADLLARLEKAKVDPPNVITASVAGVVRVSRTDNRPRQAGDQVYEQDVVAEIFPPGRMEVQVRANEVEVRRLAVGQAATVTVPALPGFTSSAEVVQVSQLGRDKFADDGQTAGVVQFAVRCKLITAAPELRQGMTAMVGLTLATRSAAAWIPRAAVTRVDGKWSVLTGDARHPVPRQIEGELFGADVFIVTAGLADGDTVLIERRSNQ